MISRYGNGKDKKAGRVNTAGLIFTAAVILCCAALFLIGREEEPPAETEEPAAAPERVYPSEQVFFERAEKSGLGCEMLPVDGYDPGDGYSLTLDGNEAAVLVISKRNGGVCAFTLMLHSLEPPEHPPEGATLIELDIFESANAEYELLSVWREEAFSALTSGLDIMGELTYGDRMEMLTAIQTALGEGKAKDYEAGDFRLSALPVTIRGEEIFSVTLSIEE